jgi:aminopeptidase
VPSSQGAQKPASAGTSHVFYGEQITAVSSLGGEFGKKNADEKREAVRKAVGGGVKSLKDVLVSEKADKPVEVRVDVAGDAHAAGSFLFCLSIHVYLDVMLNCGFIF